MRRPLARHARRPPSAVNAAGARRGRRGFVAGRSSGRRPRRVRQDPSDGGAPRCSSPTEAAGLRWLRASPGAIAGAGGARRLGRLAEPPRRLECGRSDQGRGGVRTPRLACRAGRSPFATAPVPRRSAAPTAAPPQPRASERALRDVARVLRDATTATARPPGRRRAAPSTPRTICRARKRGGQALATQFPGSDEPPARPARRPVGRPTELVDRDRPQLADRPGGPTAATGSSIWR